MKEIKLFDMIRSGEVLPKEAGVPYDLFMAYNYSMANGNDLINFADVIWEDQIEDIVRVLSECGISEFTISSTFSSLIDTLATFANYGWNMDGLTVVNSNHKSFGSSEFNRVNAIKLVYKGV